MKRLGLTPGIKKKFLDLRAIHSAKEFETFQNSGAEATSIGKASSAWFDAADTDGDGFITVDDFSKVAKIAGIEDPKSNFRIP